MRYKNNFSKRKNISQNKTFANAMESKALKHKLQKRKQKLYIKYLKLEVIIMLNFSELVKVRVY